MFFIRDCKNDGLRFHVYAILKYHGMIWYLCRLSYIYCWTSWPTAIPFRLHMITITGYLWPGNAFATHQQQVRSLTRASCMRAYAGCVIIVRVTRGEGSTRNVWCVAIYAAVDRDALAGCCVWYIASRRSKFSCVTLAHETFMRTNRFFFQYITRLCNNNLRVYCQRTR